MKPELVEPTLRLILKNLDLDYLDLYLAHCTSFIVSMYSLMLVFNRNGVLVLHL